jgi:hypothetical protein
VKRPHRNCAVCGSVFVPRARRGRLPRYCSRACKRARDLGRTKVLRVKRMAARPPLQRDCAECGRTFLWPARRRPWAKVCSPTCRANRLRRQNRNRIEIAACQGCGEEFLRRKGHHRRRLCETCHPPPRHRRELHTCRTCGVVYLPKSAERITFCSRACSYVFRRATKLARRDRRAAARRKRSFRECPVCGRLFRAQAGNRRICSAACRRRRATDAAYVWRTGRERAEGLQPRACKGCGETFTPRRPDAVHCSPRCNHRSWRRSDAGRAAERERRRRRRERARVQRSGAAGSPSLPAPDLPA